MKKHSINTESKTKQMILIVLQVGDLVTLKRIISNVFISHQFE